MVAPFLIFQQETTKTVKKYLGIHFFYRQKYKKPFSLAKLLQKSLFLHLCITFFNTISCGAMLDFHTRYGIIVWLDKNRHNILWKKTVFWHKILCFTNNK